MHIVLASISPRRKELIHTIVPTFAVVSSQCDEQIPPEMDSRMVAEYLAEQKARAVAVQYPQSVVIGADTVVWVAGEILGKPRNTQDAHRMLKMLSGEWHSVITGVAIVKGDSCERFSKTTQVKFAPMSEEEIAWYISTKEPFDKAGAYGIQGFGGIFVEEIKGDYFTVMGLPVQELYQKLKEICPEDLTVGENNR